MQVCVWLCVFGRAERTCLCVGVCMCMCDREALQQQPPPDCRTGVLSIFRLGLSPPAVAPGPMRFLISAAMVMKACSTLVAFLALVSRKGIARESANSCKEHNNILLISQYYVSNCTCIWYYCIASSISNFPSVEDIYKPECLPLV